MNSSGIKRGLATTAVSALAVAGLPLLANSASATPIAAVEPANAVDFYAPEDGTPSISARNDGTNTSVSLVVGGGVNVTSVLFQYSTATAPGTFIDIAGPVARNADGVFALEWTAVPGDVANVRAVPNTGEANADTQAVTNSAAAGNTVELATEGRLGVFQEPYGETAGAQQLVGVTGTTSTAGQAVTVRDVSHATGATANATSVDADGAGAGTTGAFATVLNIAGYPYSGGTEANQIALNAATNNTDDAEGSTLYVQTIGSITATPETQERINPSDAVVTITVLDTEGKPVAGAQVFEQNPDTDTDAGGPDTDTDGADRLVGYTDARGQVQDTSTTTAETFTYYVNTTDNDAFEPAVDKSDTATVTTYTPALSAIDIVNDRNRANFDLDELNDNDDFTIVTRDQRGAGFNEDLTGADIEYRFVIDPAGAGDTFTTAFLPGETDANGEFQVPALTDGMYNGGELPEGTYTIEARRPNVNGSGLINAAPETFQASEAEITFKEGASANAPVNGEFLVEGTLANDGGGLAGREVQITYTRGQLTYDSSIAGDAQQPAGTDQTSSTTATAVTDANGNFSVRLTDPDVPVNVTPTAENGNDVNAVAEEAANDTTSLQGNNGLNDGAGTAGDPQGDLTAANDGYDAEADLRVNFIVQPTVSRIVVNEQELYGNAGPGRPVDLDITVYGTDGDNDPNNDPVLSDYPVTVSVNKGFLSPNAENVNALDLNDAHDETGDLWGFFENLGADESLSTGDAGTNGVVVAIEKHSDFDLDGTTSSTVTVTAGGVNQTVEIDWNATSPVNTTNVRFVRADGEPTGDVPVSEELEFQLYAEDQFGNLVGDQFARISDDSTVADFRTDEDFDGTLTDFTTSGAGIVAFSDGPTVQTLTAQLQQQRTLVDANDDPVQTFPTTTAQSAPITWVGATTPPPGGGQDPIFPGLRLLNAQDRDTLFGYNLIQVRAPKADGARVDIFRVKNGVAKRIKSKTMNSNGFAQFKRADLNGSKVTRYFAIVRETEDTLQGRTKTKGIR